MSIETVKADYEFELEVLQSWNERLDIFDEVTEVPPESKMSDDYKVGWRKYLFQVLKIGRRMVKMCEEAEESGDAGALKQYLEKEADSYDVVASAARKEGLEELVVMLKHEAESRRGISAELP